MYREDFFNEEYNKQVNGTTLIVSKNKNSKKMVEKKYVNGLVIKEKTFDNGGTQLKASIATKDFIEQLKQEDDNGWVNIVISKRKMPSEKGITHYAYIDPWKPTPKTNQKAKAVKADDDMPF